MAKPDKKTGAKELFAPLRENLWAYWAVGLFSAFVNLLMLVGPLYMLTLYDRVLGSKSEETLIALTLLVVYLYLMMGLLNFVRGRVLTRIGAKYQAALEKRVFSAVMEKASRGYQGEVVQVALRDLEAIQKTLSSPIISALFDAPWTPVFLAGILLFHPWLGIMAMTGGAVLIGIAILNQFMTRSPVQMANSLSSSANLLADNMRHEAEVLRSLGMVGPAYKNWQMLRNIGLSAQLEVASLTSVFGISGKTFRMLLQSMMLGTGAYLVLQNQVTPGAMIAGSILMGRALAPIELVIGSWATIQAAMTARSRLILLLNDVPKAPEYLELGRPKAKLSVEKISVVPPGEQNPSVLMLSFSVGPGQALGVIGASGAGKSSLARAITGVWPAAAGKIRLDGAALEQYDPDVLGSYFGYLPQQVTLFDGTIAENIARLSSSPDSKKVIEAAKNAAAHEMILRLPEGYNTRTSVANSRLSGGQIQRIGLARAFYGDPVILILDEPNSNLDSEGSEALNLAIAKAKKQGKAVIIMAHRPAAIQLCDLLLVMEQGKARAFGPKEDVLKETVQNRNNLAKGKEGNLS